MPAAKKKRKATPLAPRNVSAYDLPAGEEWLCLYRLCQLLGVGRSQAQNIALKENIERVKAAPIKGGPRATFFNARDARHYLRNNPSQYAFTLPVRSAGMCVAQRA
jgi:hypothetical protein